MITVIELYHTNMSVCSQKVRFALAEKKLRWEDHHVNLQAGEQLRPEYLKLNPNAVVPTLVDNGTVIIESTVINEYLDDAYLEPQPSSRRQHRSLAHASLDQAARRRRPCGDESGELCHRFPPPEACPRHGRAGKVSPKDTRPAKAGAQLGGHYQRRRIALLPRRYYA